MKDCLERWWIERGGQHVPFQAVPHFERVPLSETESVFQPVELTTVSDSANRRGPLSVVEPPGWTPHSASALPQRKVRRENCSYAATEVLMREEAELFPRIAGIPKSRMLGRCVLGGIRSSDGRVASAPSWRQTASRARCAEQWRLYCVGGTREWCPSSLIRDWWTNDEASPVFAGATRCNSHIGR